MVILAEERNTSVDTFDVEYSDDYGQSFPFIFHNVVETQWVGSENALIILRADKTMEVLKIASSLSILSGFANVHNFFVEKFTVFIVIENSDQYLSLKMLHTSSKHIQDGVFPTFLKIKEIVQINLVLGEIYVTLKTAAGDICLFSAKYHVPRFRRKLCGIDKHTVKEYCPVYANSNLRGVLLANVADKTSTVRTVVSLNNGKDWHNSEMSQFNSNNVSPIFNLKLSCAHKEIVNMKNYWMVVVDGQLIKNSLKFETKFVSLNGGKTWKYLSLQNMPIKLVKIGNLIVTLNDDNSQILYSFDDGDLWENFSISLNSQILLSFVKVGKYENEIFSVVSRAKNEKKLTFTSIIFSNHFTRQCDITQDYDSVILPFPGSCYQGTESMYYLKKKGVQCFDKLSTHSEGNITICPCTIDDFEW
uniref:Vacuolar protein sorting/targeting protein 10 (Trinotate prediction) n=1 Tax=Henneguya salminicola TaxID=69463 RepID=A0A6G3MDJ1_HENSL